MGEKLTLAPLKGDQCRCYSPYQRLGLHFARLFRGNLESETKWEKNCSAEISNVPHRMEISHTHPHKQVHICGRIQIGTQKAAAHAQPTHKNPITQLFIN